MKTANKSNTTFFALIAFAIAPLIIYLFMFLYRVDHLTEFMVIWLLASLGSAYRSYSNYRNETGKSGGFLVEHLSIQLLITLTISAVLVTGFNLTKIIFDSLITAATDAAPSAIAVYVLVGGAVLFWFREKARRCYGATEVIVGMAIAAYKIPQTPDIQETFIIAMTGGLYLVVRGLDNIKQGKGSDLVINSLKPLLSKFTQVGKKAI